MKPIETGCTAMMINSKAGNNGIFVEVGEYVGTVFNWECDDLWEIKPNGKINIIGPSLREGDGIYTPTKQLMRIDDYHEDVSENTTEQIKETV